MTTQVRDGPTGAVSAKMLTRTTFSIPPDAAARLEDVGLLGRNETGGVIARPLGVGVDHKHRSKPPHGAGG